jgi:coenzyme PQQ precursor peptide PqqA
MAWSKPDFVEITLCMEVTAYVNTDDTAVVSGQWSVVSEEEATAASLTTDH